MKKMKKIVYAIAGLAAVTMVGSAQAGTLEDVQARGVLNCIVSSGTRGFSNPDDSGKWQGFDVDFCRATAAAVLGDADKVRYVSTTGANRFTMLNSGEGDMLYRVTTVTFRRDVDIKLTFLGVNYYDGQGFMVAKDTVDSALELDGASVCVQVGTTTELNLADYFRTNGMSYEAIPGSTSDETRDGLDAGRCDVLTTDASALAAQRSAMKDPSNWVILPEIISKEPLGPAVRQGDDAWADLVRWVLYGVIAAEEMGITSANVDSFDSNVKNPQMKRMLGLDDTDLGAMLGLDKEWLKRAIKQVGNYGEIFERHIGVNTPVGLERGVNAQWTDGGLIYAPPFN
jgi:general L-amino acid transport system substrate-binding protein